jgi:hypothetical protein
MCGGRLGKGIGARLSPCRTWAGLPTGSDSPPIRKELGSVSDDLLTWLPQCGIYLIVVFIESKSFTRRLHELAEDAADSVLVSLQSGLVDNPVRGDVVKGLGGIRKSRIANPGRGKGKRGGFRYMYLHVEHKDHIHLLFLFDKDEQEDLNAAQRAFLRQLVSNIKG